MARIVTLLVVAAALACGACAKRSGGPQVGDAAPDVAAPDADGSLVRLRSFTGRPVVVFFYPKDGTAGCTAEACSLRDHYQDLKSAGAVILGVSVQDAESHKKFADEHKLPFPLLVDDGSLSRAFGVGHLGWLDQRVTFLLGRDGRVARVWEDVDTQNHGREVLAAVRALP
jgi:peroxiredoxin Q/BCP